MNPTCIHENFIREIIKEELIKLLQNKSNEMDKISTTEDEKDLNI